MRDYETKDIEVSKIMNLKTTTTEITTLETIGMSEVVIKASANQEDLYIWTGVQNCRGIYYDEFQLVKTRIYLDEVE
ncbi:hypothetical protein HAX54_033759, partial [Datura stramonium]|nr:hypothetical protein [Datura stramonium]